MRKIAIWHEDNVLLVPAGALFREGHQWKAFVFDNGKAKAIPLEVGHTDGRKTEIIKGLPEDAQLLLHPPDTVKEGVEIVQRKTPSSKP